MIHQLRRGPAGTYHCKIEAGLVHWARSGNRGSVTLKHHKVCNAIKEGGQGRRRLLEEQESGERPLQAIKRKNIVFHDLKPLKGIIQSVQPLFICPIGGSHQWQLQIDITQGQMLQEKRAAFGGSYPVIGAICHELK